MNKILIFDIAGIRNKALGTSETYTFEGPAVLEGLELKSELKGEVEITVIEEGFNVNVSNFSVKVLGNCFKCLKKITESITIDSTERIFYSKMPELVTDPNESFEVDQKRLSIDLSEMLRQEIILHFPSNSVCSKSCKGICPICGKNSNKEQCSHEVQEELQPESNFPLAKLKDLIKSNAKTSSSKEKDK